MPKRNWNLVIMKLKCHGFYVSGNAYIRKIKTAFGIISELLIFCQTIVGI